MSKSTRQKVQITPADPVYCRILTGNVIPLCSFYTFSYDFM